MYFILSCVELYVLYSCGRWAIHNADIMFQKSLFRSWRSFGPSLRPLSQLAHLPPSHLDKTPPETQSLTFLIRDEAWKQRAASKLCNRPHTLRGKSGVGLSCRREQAMTGLCMEGWWPCIMNGAKCASAGGAEWRRWRAMGSLLQFPHYCPSLYTAPATAQKCPPESPDWVHAVASQLEECRWWLIDCCGWGVRRFFKKWFRWLYR